MAYYQDLYSTKSSHTTGKIKKFLGKLTLKKLTPQQVNNLERPITLDEVTKVLKKTKKNLHLDWMDTHMDSSKNTGSNWHTSSWALLKKYTKAVTCLTGFEWELSPLSPRVIKTDMN